MNETTIIYYTANKISDFFFQNTKKQLLLASQGLPIVSVSQKPIDLGENICVGDIGYTSLNIYRQALIGAKHAKTKYIAMAEDDVLYSLDHFIHEPTPNCFTYNYNVGTIYTWNKPQSFIFKTRRVLHSLICERDLFIEAMEERFAKYPGAIEKPNMWTEPGKKPYERRLGVTPRAFDSFESQIANIVFWTPFSLSFDYQGFRKKLGSNRFAELPYWGNAEDVVKLYKDP